MIDDIIINQNILIKDELEYELNIDQGRLYLDNPMFPDLEKNYDMTMETTHITLNNKHYSFDTFPFYAANGNIQLAKMMFRFDNIKLNVSIGRILIVDAYYDFTVADNHFEISSFIRFANTQQSLITTLMNVDPSRVEPSAPEYPIFDNPSDVDMVDLAQDTQNVHHRFILDNLHRILIKLSKNTVIKRSIYETKADIEDYFAYIQIQKAQSYNFLKRILKSTKLIICLGLNIPIQVKNFDIIESIYKNNGFISKYGMREVNILHLIWNAIYDNEDLKYIFYQNVADMRMVCLTGRITRLLDVFTGIIDDFQFSDKSKIREEMMNKCIQIRNSFTYDDALSLQDEIKKILYQDYVESMILTQKDFENELSEWLEYIE